VAEGGEDRLRALGYELPAVLEPTGSYVPAARAGSFLFTAGQLPLKEGQLPYTDKVGREVSVEDAKEAAHLCALNALAAVKAEAGSLENVHHVAKVTGYVASAECFNGQPEVMNGPSDLIGELFGRWASTPAPPSASPSSPWMLPSKSSLWSSYNGG
jgi:enamine deaminase RidA (YjgF/YER057c/UK114 family)